MTHKTHHCTITDVFVHSPTLRIEMVYTHVHGKDWHCQTTIVGDSFGQEVPLDASTIHEVTDLAMMLKSQRIHIEDMIMRIASVVAVKNREA